ncbi:RTA1-like protein [Auriscalpium vulgare]|uniref:RTA1-like protein n=1 Tax=Auriscalpium vulgare TaxID=40419 RepID=A0ACB8SCE2_9AGAM|nr:RTA1-like protein [Auriscalpium vulgare]
MLATLSPKLRRAALAAALLALCLAPSADARGRDPNLPHPADPYADPKNDPYNPLGYIASNTLTGVALGLILSVALVQTFSMFKWGAWWMLAMVIGEYTFALGIASRIGLNKNPESQGIYIIEYLFVVLSPCAFIAADYIFLGRLARHLRSGKHLFISPNRITLVFVLSDVTTFLIQAAGGGVSIGSTTQAGAETGSHIFLAGLVIQLLSFVAFTGVFIVFVLRVRRHEPQEWAADADKPWYRDWRVLIPCLALSCTGIIIRSLYRVVELSQGFTGPIAQNEAFFYGLDTLPLWVAFSVFAPFWPGRFIPPLPKGGERPLEDAEAKQSPVQDRPSEEKDKAEDGHVHSQESPSL